MAGQFLLASLFFLWLAAAGWLLLWVGPTLFVAWLFRARQARPALRAALKDLALNTEAENLMGRRHISRVTAVLARRAGLKAPAILAKPRRHSHNLEAMVQENLILATTPLLSAVAKRGLVGGPLAGVLAHEIAHLTQNRFWHHLNRPLGGAVGGAGLIVLLTGLQQGHFLAGALVMLWLVMLVLGVLDRLVSQALELRADVAAVELTGDDQDLRMGLAILTILDAWTFEPLPPELAAHFARDLRALAADLGGRVLVQGETLDVLAAEIQAKAGPRPKFSPRQALSTLLFGEWPEAHPSTAHRLALLVNTPAV